jgi:HEPN domain-containing protein
MTTNREQGEKLLKEAEYIFEKDLKIAVDEENYNLAVRRAQEVVELSLKGCLRIVGKKLVFQESTLTEIQRISKWLAEARAPSFYGERDFTSEDSRRAYNDAAFVLREIIIRTRSESRK